MACDFKKDEMQRLRVFLDWVRVTVGLKPITTREALWEERPVWDVASGAGNMGNGNSWNRSRAPLDNR